MQHFVLTRFNDVFINPVGPCQITFEKNPLLGLNTDWLKKRIYIFKNITLPSILNQTDSEFIWILKCHPDTPDWAKKELESNFFITSYDKFPIKKTTYEYYANLFSLLIKKFSNQKNIITTRIDSDDAISNFHIEYVKKFIKPNKFFDFNNGIVNHFDGFYSHKKNGISQFCSYMEESNDCKTVYHIPHNQIKKEQTIIINSEIGWMQNNTSNNITTQEKFKRKYNISNKLYQNDFISLKKKFGSLFRKLFI